MSETSTSKKQLYIGMMLLIIIALLLLVKMVTTKVNVPSGIFYMDEHETIIGGFTNQEIIVVPEGVTDITERAIADTVYGQVKILQLPASLERIENVQGFCKAFPKVEQIVWGMDSVSAGYLYADGILYEKRNGEFSYGAAVFSHLAKGEVIMPDAVQTVRASLFDGMTEMTSITLGKNFAYIDNGQGNLERLTAACFASCEKLKEIRVGAGNAFYRSGNDALYCRDIDRQEATDVPDWMLLAVPRACEGEYKVEPGVATIGPGAFYECDKITEISISEGVTEIKEQAFTGCDALKNVNIPFTVQSIHQSFADCENLKEITFTGVLYYSNVTYEDLLGEGVRVKRILVPAGCETAYRNVLSDKEAKLVKEGTFIAAEVDVAGLKQPNFYADITEDGQMYFQWNQVPYAQDYYLQQEVYGNWKTIRTLRRVHSSYIQTMTAKDVGLQEGTVSRFRIVAYANGEMAYSKGQSVCYMLAPKLIAVKNKEAKSLFVRWEMNKNVSGYCVEVTIGDRMIDVVRIDNPSQESVTIYHLEKGNVYDVKVYAYMEKDGEIFYSDKTGMTRKVTF